MERYAMYLRKSRADLDAEAHGEGETLARHKAALFALAKRLNIAVDAVYEEIVSGESIAARPKMMQLLNEVDNSEWTGVLVMEVERLARGNTIDQGIVAQAFKESGTLILTPLKTYDPANEFDEEYLEFGLFMSRREYVTINRRLQRGREASIKEGKYVGNKPPYGYKRVKLDGEKGFTLEPVPEQAEVVRLIFEWYTQGVPEEDGTRRRIGTQLIARKLNEMLIPSATGDKWTLPSVRDLLTNETYTGKVRWNRRPSVKKTVDGKKQISRPRSSNALICKGLHPAIISEDVFNQAQAIIKQNPPRPVKSGYSVKNPLAGLLVCGMCGRKMVRRPYGARRKVDSIMCAVPECKNVSSDLYLVEERVIDALRDWLINYKLEWQKDAPKRSNTKISVQKKTVEKRRGELETLEKQISKAHDLLEQGIYDTNTFLRRSRELSERADALKTEIDTMQNAIDTENARAENAAAIIPKIEHLLEVYNELPNAQTKNEMLKEVLEKAEYSKTTNARWHGSADNFELVIYPKLPNP